MSEAKSDRILRIESHLVAKNGSGFRFTRLAARPLFDDSEILPLINQITILGNNGFILEITS